MPPVRSSTRPSPHSRERKSLETAKEGKLDSNRGQQCERDAWCRLIVPMVRPCLLSSQVGITFAHVRIGSDEVSH